MSTESSLRRPLRRALPLAIKARDRTAVAALRSTLAAIDNAEAAAVGIAAERGIAIEQSPVGAGATQVERRVLTEAGVREVVRTEQFWHGTG